MATLTKAEQLDRGVPIDEDGLGDYATSDVQAYTDAFYTAVMGRRATPTGLGFFYSRIARTVTGAVVAGDAHKAALPGPVLHVQATAGTSTGPKIVIVTGTPGAGQVRIDTDLGDGRDTLTFAAGDAVTTCAYRQQAMPEEMYDALVSNTDPPISS